MKKTLESMKRAKHYPSSWLKDKNYFNQNELRQALKHSYQSKRLWGEFVSLYLTLFLDETQAEEKARTHSVAVMCRNIRNQTGCSFQQIYDCVMKEVVDSNLVVDNTILKLNNKWEFIDSVFEIES